jgi:hypothetical protein
MMYRHRQLHLWITEHDYRVLRTWANSRQETLSSVIRRLIKSHQDAASRPPATLSAVAVAVDGPPACRAMPMRQSMREHASNRSPHARR